MSDVGEVDFAVTYDGTIRMRCNAFYQRGHTAIALRLLPLRVPTVKELALPPVIVDQAEKPRGLVLLTGPTGSGKSSTLAALLDHINHNTRRHIITLENPIEFIHSRDKCIINQREVGDDTESFAAGLRAALRQDPDVILVGEMRDLETISTAITAAETGHLVFGTLHTKSAPNAIDRIIDVFPPEQQEQIRIQLAEVLEAVIGKTLLPKIGGGRIAAYEILLATPAVRSLIRQNKSFQIPSTMQTSKKQGMQLLDDALGELVRKGVATLDDALVVANDPATMRSQFGR
jgi:twitching motility protein PilT